MTQNDMIPAAGTMDPEQHWSVPDNAHVAGWLGEARSHFRADRNARAIGRVVNAHTMQRIIRLVMRVNASEEYADQLRRERDEAREAASIAQEALGKANERAERWVRAYERLEAKLRNAQLKAKAVHDAPA